MSGGAADAMSGGAAGAAGGDGADAVSGVRGDEVRSGAADTVRGGAADTMSTDGTGKAGALRRLADAQFDVPPFVVVPPEALAEHVTALDGPPTEATLLAAPVSEATVRCVRSALAALPGGGPVAVRSAMAGEDGARLSYAGQLVSFLDVAGEDAVVDAVRRCWAAAYSPGVDEYRRRHGVAGAADAPREMSVIIQRMVDADAAGIAFSVDPVAGDAGTAVVTAVAGLGDGLASGRATGWTWYVDRRDLAVDGAAEGVPLTAEGVPLTAERVPPTAEGVPLTAGVAPLTAGEVREVARAAIEAERLFGSPQDIEYAFTGGTLWLLQARPVTTPVYAPESRIVWDNANIVESYSGTTSPLTFSVIREAYAGVYRAFLSTMGVREVDEHLVRHMLGYRSGRVYYQLQSWYAALALLPWFAQNRRFMERMMGTRSAPIAAPAHGPVQRAAFVGRLAWLHATHRRRVRRFQSRVESVLAEHAQARLRAADTHGLWLAYRDLESRVLGAWVAPILTDFFAMVSFGVVERLCARWLPGTPGAVLELVAGGAGAAVEPLRALDALAAAVSADPEAAALFAGSDPADCVARLRDDPRFAGVREAFDGYLDRYGDRGPDELKLEVPALRDEPERLVVLVATASARAGRPGAGEDGPAAPGDSRARARWATGTTAGGVDGPVPARPADGVAVAALRPWRRAALRGAAGLARRHLADREAMRLTRTRTFGVLRSLFGELGRRWAEAGALDAPEDVFFLTVRELWDHAGGTAASGDLRATVASRRAESAGWASHAAPSRFETFGPPYWATPRVSSKEAQRGALQGVGCSAGVASGVARCVRDARAVPDLKGGVLVAERTDPGWVHLFATAAAIVVERGSPLSHVSIVARELGVPAVVGIRGVTELVRDGDYVTVDGSTGTVTIEAGPGRQG